jgi:hypothetical protein
MRQITAFFFLFLLLLGTTGFSMSLHYCMDRLVDAALFGTARSCGMEAPGGACPAGEEGSTLTSASCCRDLSISQEAQDEVQSPEGLSWQPAVPVTPCTNPALPVSIQSETPHFSFAGKSPPLTGPALRIRLQSFLI